MLLRTRCTNPRLATRSFHRVSVHDALRSHKQESGFFVDVRHPLMYQGLAPVGFTNVPHFDFTPQTVSAFPRNTPIYLLDSIGGFSEACATILEKEGFKQVNVIEGGLFSWINYNGPVNNGDPEAQKELDRLKSADFSFQAVRTMVEKATGKVVNDDAVRLPGMRDMFGSKEEAEEAWNSLPRRMAKGAKGGEAKQ